MNAKWIANRACLAAAGHVEVPGQCAIIESWCSCCGTPTGQVMWAGGARCTTDMVEVPHPLQKQAILQCHAPRHFLKQQHALKIHKGKHSNNQNHPVMSHSAHAVSRISVCGAAAIDSCTTCAEIVESYR
eukprot:2273242-Rhodomonas_salina.2